MVYKCHACKIYRQIRARLAIDCSSQLIEFIDDSLRGREPRWCGQVAGQRNKNNKLNLSMNTLY